jgi:trehalose 6-phosphate synthase
VIYIHRSIPFHELAALYAVSDACLLASTRDGMNLVAFEYVACQAERQGSLLISEFAGAATIMKPASITFNPANLSEIADAIHEGLTMNSEKRKARYSKLKEIVEHNTRSAFFNFARTFANDSVCSRRWGEAFAGRLSQNA